MNEPQSLDNWIVNFQTAQRQRHTQFLKALKHEFTQRTRQQRRDYLNQINPPSTEGMARAAKVRRGRPAAADKRTKAQT